MAPKQWKCLTPGCSYVTEEVEASDGIEFLKLHASQNHGVASKPEKPKKPVLEIVGNTIDMLDWEAFLHKFEVYKKLSGITADAGSHLLDCLSKEVYAVLFSTYGSEISSQDEKALCVNLKRLVVRKQNKLLNIMELLGLKQDSDERILNFISRVKAKARQCDLSIKCKCGTAVDFKDNFTLYMLVSGLNDSEIQEDLLTEEDLTLEGAEKRAIAKESAKYSQSWLAGDNIQRLKSSYQQEKSDPSKRKCRFCGLQEHKSREKECKAFSEICKKCGKVGHFQKVCRSKKSEKVDPKVDEKKNIQDNDNIDGEDHCAFWISAISTSDLVYDKKCRRWIQKKSSDKRADKLPVMMSICKDSYIQLNKGGSKAADSISGLQASVEGVADTGCSTLCAGPDICKKLGIKQKDLIKSDIFLRVADGRRLTVIGAIPVTVSIRGHETKQILHVATELKSLFLSKRCLSELGVISPTFPFPPEEQIRNVDGSESDAAPCGCKVRTEAPDPPPLPLDPTEENIPALKEFIIHHYSSSTMNMCTHQTLPEITGPPLHYTLKDGVTPRAVHTPATIPVHWKEQVEKQLDRDVDLGILRKVPHNEPAEWQHRMVVVRKKNGSPRRTVDMQALNECTLRLTHPLTSPYLKAMSVPSNMYKTVMDAWEGYRHQGRIV